MIGFMFVSSTRLSSMKTENKSVYDDYFIRSF